MPDSPLRIERSFNIGGHLPLGVLSPEALARVQSGGELTEAEMTQLQTAALADAGVVGRLIGAALASGAFKRQPPDAPAAHSTGAGAVAADPQTVVVPGSVQSFEWRWDGSSPEPEAAKQLPRTYYELLGGRPDPMGETFATLRRWLNYATLALVLGVTALLIGIAFATGQTPDTIFFVGMFSAIVAAMIWHSLPRSPFG